MKRLKLKTTQYQVLIQSFQTWLRTLNYSPVTAETFPVHVKEYLCYLETIEKITDIKEVKRRESNNYISYLHRRPNKTYSGGLSLASIKKQVVSVNTFHKFLIQMRGLDLEPISMKAQEIENEIQVLSVQEVKDLYEASYYESRENPTAMGARDRAILALLYGCGLRRSEALKLNLSRVDTSKAELTIRDTKSRKERLVPVIGRAKDDLEEYIYNARYYFTTSHAQRIYRDRPKKYYDKDALLLNKKGSRLSTGLYNRLAILKKRAGLHKSLTPHILRHSIATHLLSAGMKLEQIAEFLGHQSLESTQIYTHVAHSYEKLQDLAS